MPPDASLSHRQEKVHLTRAWLQKANDDLLVAGRATLPLAALSFAVFLCQQAAEKGLKAFLTWHDQPFRKTHELEQLLDQCVTIDGEFTRLAGAAEILSPYAVEPRYPGAGGDPTPEQADQALRLGHAAPWASAPSVAPPEQADQALRLGHEVVAFVRVALPPDVWP